MEGIGELLQELCQFEMLCCRNWKERERERNKQYKTKMLMPFGINLIGTDWVGFEHCKVDTNKVGSNIDQNYLSTTKKCISDHYIPIFT